MCITLAIASTAMSVVGAVQQANAQKAQAEYNAAVARNNAIIAEQNAQDVEQRGDVALAQRRQALNQTIGSARAAIAGSGLLVDDAPETTPAMLLDDLTVAGQMDILTLEGNIARESRRARIQGMETKGNLCTINAEVPLAEMFGYATAIRSLSKGRSSYSMEPSHFEEVPAQVKAAILEQKA